MLIRIYKKSSRNLTFDNLYGNQLLMLSQWEHQTPVAQQVPDVALILEKSERALLPSLPPDLIYFCLNER